MQVYRPINDVQQTEYRGEKQASLKQNSVTPFCAVFENKINESLQFSKHASLRLAARNINLSESQIERVEDGLKIAKEKGVRSSLVMVDNVALVVNIPNKTVVTAVSGGSQNVFTNIDGAVVV